MLLIINQNKINLKFDNNLYEIYPKNEIKFIRIFNLKSKIIYLKKRNNEDELILKNC